MKDNMRKVAVIDKKEKEESLKQIKKRKKNAQALSIHVLPFPSITNTYTHSFYKNTHVLHLQSVGLKI